MEIQFHNTNAFSMLKTSKERRPEENSLKCEQWLKMFIVVICRSGNCGLFTFIFLYLFPLLFVFSKFSAIIIL